MSTLSMDSNLRLWLLTLCSYLLLLVMQMELAQANRELDPFYCNITHSYEECRVPYQSSMLVLNCPGGKSEVKWQHSLRNETYTICSDFTNRSCIVRGYQGELSSDDSGYYYCIESKTVSKKVLVTILAPPQITSVVNWPGICQPYGHRNSCLTSTVTYTDYEDTLHLSVSYTSVGSANVHWFINDSEIHCPVNNNQSMDHYCTNNITTENSSTIVIYANEIQKVNGRYRAIVSNAYGSNESVTPATYNCNKEPDRPVPCSPKDVFHNVTAGKHINLEEVCKIDVPLGPSHYFCYTNKSNGTYKEADFANCAKCNTPEECWQQFGNNDHYHVTSQMGTCPQSRVSFSFQSRLNTRASHDDSGKIFCFVKGEQVPYTTVHIRVVDESPNLLPIEIVAPAGFLLIVVTVLLIVITLQCHKYRKQAVKHSSRKRERRRRREAEREALLVQDEGGPSTTYSGVQGPVQRRPGYDTFPSAVNVDINGSGNITEVQSDFPGTLPVQASTLVHLCQELKT